MINLLKPAKFAFIISGLCVIASILLLIFYTPRLSIEFSGGTRMEIISDTATAEQIHTALRSFDADLNPTVNATQDGAFIIRTTTIDNDTHTKLIAHLNTAIGAFTEEQYTTIGPTVGATLKFRAVVALLVASIGIILYVAWAFRKIPRKYNAWKFGITAVITLLHDVIITAGIFTILSHVTSFEVDTLFVTALLTILGYSVNDTIIIFDRIRDNLAESGKHEAFPVLANKAVVQTLTRSLYTSVSTLIMLFALYFLGSESIQWFVLTLIIGFIIGSYSSIFVATPLLVYWRKQS